MNKLLIDQIYLTIRGLQINCFFEKTAQVSDGPDSTVMREEKTSTLKNKLHQHSYYEIFFAKHIEVNTESKVYTYNNSAIIIPPTLKHHALNDDIYTSFIFSISEPHKKTTLYKKLSSQLNTEDIICINNLAPILYLLNNVCKELYEPTQFAVEKIQSNLVLIFLYLLEQLNISSEPTTTPATSTTTNTDYALLIDNVIHSRFTEKLTLNDLASTLNLSPVHTARVVKKIYGTSFSTVLNNQRLLVATTLLKNTQKSIESIIEDLNFLNQNYFFALFKKKYGISPLQYRKKYSAIKQK